MITAAYTPDVYTGNGSTTVFAYNFKIVDQAHIKVEEVVIATGVRTTLDIGTHYSVSGVGEDAGGNVTMVTAPASTKKLVLSLSIPVRQNTNFENQGEYFAEDHEDALDLLTLMVQQAREELDRTPKVTIESGETGDDLIASIEADVAAAAASASAAATSATNAATSATNAATSATAAAASATTASTQATNAATSATNAANSATAAQTAETNAETAETNAAASASAASTSATNAATSASAASTSATNAATSATNAANSATTASTAATNAGNSATAAATSATNAATSATNAATSETNAATSATLAEDWAQKTSGTVAGAGTYSAKEWAVGTQTRGVAGSGSAKDWATYTGGTVDGTLYSAKYYADLAAGGAAAGGDMTGGWNFTAATIASASTTNIGGADANYIIITGTTTITALGTAQQGSWRICKFSGILTLTHNASSLILPGGANITTAAGDVAEFTSEGSGNWRCTSYMRADGTALVGPTAELNTLKNNLMRLSFQVQVASALSVLNFEDGISDVFTDQTGIDDTTSTNEMYSASGDYYTNLVTSATTKFDEYGSANASSSEPLISDGTFWEEAGQALTIAADTYITSIKFWLSVGGSTPNGVIECRIYAATGTVGSTATPTGSVLATSGNVNGSAVGSAAWHTFTFASPYFAAAGDYVFVLHWTGDNNYSAYPSIGFDNTSPTHAGNYTHKHAGGSHLAVSGTDAIFELYGYTESLGNMTLVSEAFTADAAPSTARIVVDEEDVDAVTINTDLTAEVSRDGGTTWSAVTLALDGPNASGRKTYSGEVSVAAQPSGTSMKYRLATFNLKEQKIHGVALLWKA